MTECVSNLQYYYYLLYILKAKVTIHVLLIQLTVHRRNCISDLGGHAKNIRSFIRMTVCLVVYKAIVWYIQYSTNLNCTGISVYGLQIQICLLNTENHGDNPYNYY